MAFPGFQSIAALKREVKRAWRWKNPRRWGRTFWREVNQRCGTDPHRWLEWLLDMEADVFMGCVGPEVVLALENLHPDRWQYHYRAQLLERIINNPWGLARLQDEYLELYGNDREETRVLVMEEGSGTRTALASAA